MKKYIFVAILGLILMTPSAHAETAYDVPTLLTTIERLENTIKDLQSQIDKLKGLKKTNDTKQEKLCKKEKKKMDKLEEYREKLDVKYLRDLAKAKGSLTTEVALKKQYKIDTADNDADVAEQELDIKRVCK